MKLQFKVQSYQTHAVESVVDCFAGQTNSSSIQYRIEPGLKRIGILDNQIGFKNDELQLPKAALLQNIQNVQRRQNLPLSDALIASPACNLNLDIEMETGTGKTYCYLKTIFEMNRQYGWSKYIIVVPSIAIREGVLKTLQITSEHFIDHYGKKARFFVYNSRQLHDLESFSSSAEINIMVINIQAFNARGKDHRRIYLELDDFQSRKPIDVISSNRPILILDEPQKMGGSTQKSLKDFNPLMVLRYSATHKKEHNKVHRLDALDAYNQKLVKKIVVRGISVRGLAGTYPYLYLESIEVSKKAPVARLEIEVQLKSGVIQRKSIKVEKGCNLFAASGELDQYQDRFVVSNIDANSDTLELSNGLCIYVGEAIGDITESAMRRIQIRETIKAHLEKEMALFCQGIKVLSLFFIDEVAKYRDYNQEDGKGEYARIFEEEYGKLVKSMLRPALFESSRLKEYRAYLDHIDLAKTHNGYFSIDKKTKHLTDPNVKKRGEGAGLSDDIDAYDLILKDKERLLSLEEPVRFIFSHSALREGWDNPNVFVMCMLKHSDNTISRRQEVGRGLRLAVNRDGERMDHPATVHDINKLTVVASESYKAFVVGLQNEIHSSLSARPQKADMDYFTGKAITTESGETILLTEQMAKQAYRYLLKNDYIDDNDHIADAYHQAKREGTLAALPEGLDQYSGQLFGIIDSVYSQGNLPTPEDDRKPKTNPLNDNFHKKEFKELWERINRKAVYQVDFDSTELITNCIDVVNRQLRVIGLQYTVQAGVQHDQLSDSQLGQGKGFKLTQTEQAEEEISVRSEVKYDLLGKLAENTQLTRRSIAAILSGIDIRILSQFQVNPEQFISEVSRLINEQKATIIVEHLSYDTLAECHELDIFTGAQSRQDLSKAGERLKRHIFDYAITDSNIEREFVCDLDSSAEVVVYAKLPRGFFIPTPVGDYNPDWAIAFREGRVKHIYFVAETKGSMSSMQLRLIEEKKIECARRFFDKINGKVESERVKYDVITDYEKLMSIVSG